MGKPLAAVVLNGSPSKKKKYNQSFHRFLTSAFDVTVFETRHRTEAVALAAQAQQSGFRYILAGGGDGSLHQVLNGIAQQEQPWAALGVVPLGSGNDFNKMMGLSAEPGEWFSAIQPLQTRPVDIARVRCNNDEGQPVQCYSINAIDTGMGPDTIDHLDRFLRWLPPSLRYQAAILLTFLTYHLKNVKVCFDHGEWSGPTRTVVVANGRSFASGLGIGPAAKVDDGLLDLFIAGRVSAWEFIRFVPRLKQTKMIEHPQLHYAQAATLELSADRPCGIEAEGEKIGWLPAKIEVIPRALSFIC